MSQELSTLLITAASIGFFHTLFGPDHYLPFVVMKQARKWSLIKTTWITFLCGIGHVGSSVLLGLIGVAFGTALAKLEIVESFRGELAAWALIAFGLVYSVWGLRRAVRNKPHAHLHSHGNGVEHSHSHEHNKEHVHIHDKEGKANITPWVLFTVFVLGPCEPLIPVLMYPAAQSSFYGLVMVTLVFSAVTIATMITIVIVSSYGINLLPFNKLEKYSHALAGAAIFLCGIAIQFLGL
ncbi:MAG: sulfite exporter TauE/SafE family protein [Ignavibacteria bacterium]|nr:sulfite exporter TauE/SafE family protein [Ignavibacteria bacterium]